MRAITNRYVEPAQAGFFVPGLGAVEAAVTERSP